MPKGAILSDMKSNVHFSFVACIGSIELGTLYVSQSGRSQPFLVCKPAKLKNKFYGPVNFENQPENVIMTKVWISKAKKDKNSY